MKIRITAAAAIALFVVAPFTASNAQATSLACNDGTTSTAVGKGACSGHGGVKTATKASTTGQTKAANKTTPKADGKTKSAPKADAAASKKKSGPSNAPKVAAKPDAKVASKPDKAVATKPADASDKDSKNATALCKDGTYSHAATHTGACSGHGGVNKFLK